jgi:hypothetical protein
LPLRPGAVANPKDRSERISRRGPSSEQSVNAAGAHSSVSRAVQRRQDSAYSEGRPSQPVMRQAETTAWKGRLTIPHPLISASYLIYSPITVCRSSPFRVGEVPAEPLESGGTPALVSGWRAFRLRGGVDSFELYGGNRGGQENRKRPAKTRPQEAAHAVQNSAPQGLGPTSLVLVRVTCRHVAADPASRHGRGCAHVPPT